MCICLCRSIGAWFVDKNGRVASDLNFVVLKAIRDPDERAQVRSEKYDVSAYTAGR